MSNPFISEIRIVSWSFAARGWALTNGQLLPINQNQALFSLLGTTYGGDGRVNFGLPNLQSRSPMHAGQGSGLTARNLGDFGGTEFITQQSAPIPSAPTSPVNANIGSRPHLPTLSPFIALTFLIALQGIFPSRS